MPPAAPDFQQFADSLWLLKAWLAALSVVQLGAGIAQIFSIFRRSPSLDTELARLTKLESDLTRVETLVEQLKGISASRDDVANIRARLDGFATNRVTKDRVDAIEQALKDIRADLRADMVEVRRLLNDHTRAIGQAEAVPHD